MSGYKSFSRLIIAAYRLPFRFIPTKHGFRAIQNSGGLVSAMLALANSGEMVAGTTRQKIVWAGVANGPLEQPLPKTIHNRYFDIVPVSISEALNDLFYVGFCNDLIWPLFHYFPSYAVFNDEYFGGFQEANERFCDEIAAIAKPGDFIWIHDYQLFLLPEMIRSRVPGVTIGFFLHIPFPNFELFRLLPDQWRKSIISGMLGADLIGFHTEEYAQYFLTAVNRVTGLESDRKIIHTPDKKVKVDAFPIGIDYLKFHEACKQGKVLDEKARIQNTLPGQKLVFSVDRLDYSKGLLFRLEGFERFLEVYPEWQSKVVFNMVVVPSRDTIGKYREMKREIESMVGRINGKYSTLAWRPVIYQYKSLTFHELVALYDVSDVGLVTPLRDGMNLVAKEYVACQCDNKGVLVLSEMAGAAMELREALIINPFDTEGMARAIQEALVMKPEEKVRRLKKMHNRLMEYDVFTWADDFFTKAFEIKEKQRISKEHPFNGDIANKILTACRTARRRIFFLDYDGTIVPFHSDPDQAGIEAKSLAIIEGLSSDPDNHVVIISGRTGEFLDSQFGGVDVTLVAEHGYSIKRRGGAWKTTCDCNQRWKASVMTVLQEYQKRCQGTFIEVKNNSLAWHYRNADTDLANIRLAELKEDLSRISRGDPGFELMEGNKVLEIKGGTYDKGQAAGRLILEDQYDFILAAGDDRTDEYLFESLPDSAYTLKVGSGLTVARYTVPELSIVLKLLASLAGITKQSK